MSSIRTLAGDTAIYGISTVMGRLLNFMLVPFYTHIFVPGEYGVVTELYAYIPFLIVIYTYGMETAFFRYARSTGDTNRTFRVALLSLFFTSALFSFLLLTFSGSIADALGYGGQTELIRLTALILLFDTLTVIPFALLRHQRKALRFSYLKVGQILLNISFNLWFLVACPWLAERGMAGALLDLTYDPSVGVGYVFISNMLASFIILPFFIPEFRRFRLQFDPLLWKSMLAFSLPLIIVGIAGMVNEMSGRILLKHLLPYDMERNMHLLGIYGACYKLSIFMILIVQAFRFAAEPFFFREAEDKNAPDTYARLMNYFIATGMMIFTGVSLFLGIIKYIISPDYHEGIHIVPILLLANLFLGIFYNTSVWFKLTGKTMAGGFIALSGAALTISGNIILIPLAGYTGAAVTTLLCYIFMSLFSWIWGNRHYPIGYDTTLIVKMVMSGIFVYLLAEWISLLLGSGVSLLPDVRDLIFPGTGLSGVDDILPGMWIKVYADYFMRICLFTAYLWLLSRMLKLSLIRIRQFIVK